MRYLFGPVNDDFAKQNLHEARAAGDCLTFNDKPPADIVIAPEASWDSVTSQLPAGWGPEFIALYLPYTSIPGCLWTVPVPLVGLAADWNLLWHSYRRYLCSCELILTDTPGVEVLNREGMTHAVAANLFGCERRFLEAPLQSAIRNPQSAIDSGRDIDVLFAGNVHPAVQHERLAWLGRLSQLGERWKVVIRSGVFGDEYLALLRRARIVFNRSIRGECNRRVFETIASGALLFQEAENREVPAYFADGKECVYYSAENLAELLNYYLEHEDERYALTDAAQRRVQEFSFAKMWSKHVELIAARLEELRERARRRPALVPADERLVVFGVAADGPRSGPGVGSHAERGNQEVGECTGGVDVVQLLRGELPPVATERARQCLAALDTGSQTSSSRAALWSDAGQASGVQQPGCLVQPGCSWDCTPPGFDLFRVEWERAAWQNAGDRTAEHHAKRELLRWRLHMFLAEQTGDVLHAYEAVAARPDLPTSRDLLGRGLAAIGRSAEAAHHLRLALVSNPFDAETARLLRQVLDKLGDSKRASRLAAERHLLARAAPRLAVPESWFEQIAPASDELASIVILCCNQLEFTQLCLESVLRHTNVPFELVLVDNGSTDATPMYLEEFADRHRAEGVGFQIIRNETNRGFPAGCNQGLERARGKYLVFLNNDTVVTSGWLENLIAWSKHDWPTVGLVGPVTNYARPPQQIPVDYVDLCRTDCQSVQRMGRIENPSYNIAESSGLKLAHIDAFAARRRHDFARQAMQVERLSGFCLLTRRDVLDKIGGFDERFGLGFFDDDDLSVRALSAGYKLFIALNVFVHHFGSRTFAGLGIDCPKQLDENFARFKDKWGERHAEGYQRGDAERGRRGEVATRRRGDTETRGQEEEASEPWTFGGPLTGVALCVIARNEEKNLAACLKSAAGLCDQVIVVDTGSTDRTREIAREFGAQVFDFPWVDSFAAARNECLRHATSPWIFWLDADDRLDEENRDKLRELFASLRDENVAYAMKCLCLPDAQTGTATLVDHIRLFRNHPEIRWKYRVHEQILPSVRRLQGEVRWTDVVIQHAGYLDKSLHGSKQQRNLRLLRLEDAEHPNDPFTMFNVGSAFEELGQWAEALPYYWRSLELSDAGDSIVRKLYASCVQCHRKLGHYGDALSCCGAGRRLFPEDAELLFLEGVLSEESGDLRGAERCFQELLTTEEGPHFASVDSGLRGYKTRHNLATIYLRQGCKTEAADRWREALTERPDFKPAWLGLADLALERAAWAEVESICRQLEQLPDGQLEACVLRARAHLGRKEFARALALLEEAIVSAPQVVWPRLILSHVLLQEGKDLDAAERALREVLALDPNNVGVQNNLRLLLEQRGKVA